MKIAIAQLNYHIGNFEGNTNKMIEAINKALLENADLICFSELATCGYPPRDFLEFDDFIHLAEECINTLLDYSHDIAIVVGSPSKNPVAEGKDLYNSAYFLHKGKIEGVQHKTLLPTYDIFDEYRYFEPASKWSTVEFMGKKIALTVCEDIWDVHTNNPLYTIVPLDEMKEEKPDLILNLSASPFNPRHTEERFEVVRANVRRYGIPICYVNTCGAQTEIIFDGGSIVMCPNESFVELPYFEESLQYFNLSDLEEGIVTEEQEKDRVALIYQGLICGIKNYFGKLGFKKAMLGLSGGIDSAVTLVLAAEALGPDNVRVLLMPSQYSSDHSINDARELAENLGVMYDIVPIKQIYNSIYNEISPLFDGKEFNVTEENIQARIRGILNMAISNKHGHILLNTTNKSEMAVGYGTLYGDLCGGLSVIGDVYKMDVYRLARYINRNKEIIPENSIVKPPSAELRPNQKDSDSLPDYEVLDKILFQYIEMRKDPQDIIDMGYEEKLVKRILRLVNINEFKRHQTAPVLRVSSKAFGMGRRMPIVAKYLS